MRSIQSLTLAVWALTAVVGAGVVTEIVRPRVPAPAPAELPPSPPARIESAPAPEPRDVGAMMRVGTFEDRPLPDRLRLVSVTTDMATFSVTDDAATQFRLQPGDSLHSVLHRDDAVSIEWARGWRLSEILPDRAVFTRGTERATIPVDPR